MKGEEETDDVILQQSRTQNDERESKSKITSKTDHFNLTNDNAI